MNNARTPGAVLYARVSTNEQAEHGTSMDSQREACRAKALALGLPIVSELEDPGVSGGFFLSRPGIQAALALIKQGKADTLICAAMSRYSRDTEHQQAMKKAVRNAGGRIVFCDMDFADTPEGDMMFGLMGNYAEYERQAICVRTMNGRRRKAAGGIQTARGWAPYGYTLWKTADAIAGRCRGEDVGSYTIDEVEAQTLRWLFQSYAAGLYSLPGLARELNTRKVPTKHGAAFWHPPTIRGFFVNTVYIGQPRYGKMTSRTDESRLGEVRPSTGEFYRTRKIHTPADPEKVLTLSAPPLVDRDTWDAVQSRLAVNKSRRGGNPCRAHMLSGRVACEVCGAKMYLNGGTSRIGAVSYYTCCRHKEGKAFRGGSQCTGTESYNVPIVEEATVQAIAETVARPEVIAQAIHVYRKTQERTAVEDPRRELAALDRALSVLADDEAAAVQAQIAGIRAGASPNAYTSVFADLAAKRKDLEDRRGVLSRTMQASAAPVPARRNDDAQLKAQILADVQRVLLSPNVSTLDKRRAIGMVVEKVYCRRDGAVVTFLPGVLAGVGDTLGADTLNVFERTLLWDRPLATAIVRSRPDFDTTTGLVYTGDSIVGTLPSSV